VTDLTAPPVHEHQFPEVDQDGTLVTYPCLLCGLPVADALKLAAEDRNALEQEMAAVAEKLERTEKALWQETEHRNTE
jgi:hypothetical protein